MSNNQDKKITQVYNNIQETSVLYMSMTHNIILEK
jgi:hypothetical protein